MYNANNYGYNPYGRYMPQQPMIQQSPLINGQNNLISANSPVINGKMVESEDIVKTIEIPLDGSISYFPLVDGSAIVSKQLQQDGTSKIVVYEPKIEKQSVKYATIDDIDKKIEKLDFSEIDDLKEKINDLKKELKELKSKLKTKKED